MDGANTYDGGCGKADCVLCGADFEWASVSALNRYRSMTEGEDICVDCGAHEEQACEFDCLTRRLATETDLDENI